MPSDQNLGMLRIASALLAACILIGGCEPGSAPVSAEQQKEMSATPWGLWSATDGSGGQIQLDAGGELTYTDARGTQTGTYALNEAASTIEVELNGVTQTWKFARKDLNLDITYPDNRTVTYTMQ
jgi:hypothetical protein